MLSNLPPGVTDSMIPGNGPIFIPGAFAADEFEELTEREFEELETEPSTVSCDRCSDVVGPYWGRNRRNPDVDALYFAVCWMTPDERIVCDDCREAMTEE